MDIVFILVGSIFFAFIFCILKVLFQMTDHQKPSNPKPPKLLRSTPTLSHRNAALRFHDNNYNQATMNNYPRTLALHKRILVNLNIMECQLTKLEQFLSARRPRGYSKPRRRTTVRIPVESDSGSNQ
ncbi:kita-kyushu lung cancer antigen 1 [Mesocricetus auratus]|uniref:Kita-kyushu lung cancer antigen 1 n=1 Tax=Mesocricetus auratus TaxID=10036 RepID=A0ABM2XAE4_MESAU|nr:kita-kyushu lung cancer antigen 1 [Mesocricetus auratus]